MEVRSEGSSVIAATADSISSNVGDLVVAGR
jgi:hypothetical protein